MRSAYFALVVFLAFSSTSSAAPPISFESALNRVRAQILKARADQVSVKNTGLAGDIRRLSRELGRRDWGVRRLKNRIGDLRRRAQRIARDTRNGGRSNDFFFESDLRRLIWDLRDLERDMDRYFRILTRIVREVQKDPALVSPARALDREARSLESETNWLDNEARWASRDIRRAGYNFEAEDVERHAGDIYEKGRDLKRGARRLLNKIR